MKASPGLPRPGGAFLLDSYSSWPGLSEQPLCSDLILDLGKIRNRAGGGADFIEQLQAIFAYLGVVVLHVWALHVHGSNNPAGIEKKTTKDTLPFHPYFTVKDGFALVCFLVFYGWFVFYVPNYLGDADNYIEANPLQTPVHIVPEWYYLPFYAILRSIPNKLGGAAA